MRSAFAYCLICGGEMVKCLLHKPSKRSDDGPVKMIREEQYRCLACADNEARIRSGLESIATILRLAEKASLVLLDIRKNCIDVNNEKDWNIFQQFESACKEVVLWGDTYLYLRKLEKHDSEARAYSILASLDGTAD